MSDKENKDLSDRELEIIRLVAAGASNKEIAQRLVISANTVKVHLRNIFDKIDVSSRTEAAMFAVANGLVETQTPEVEGESALLLKAPQVGAVSERKIMSKPRLYWAIFGFLLVLSLVFYWSISLANRTAPLTAPSGTAVSEEDSRWKEKKELPVPRSALALVTFDNQIFVIAGETKDGVSNRVDRYDTKSDEWIELPKKPTAVADVKAVVIGGKVYVPGGRTANGKTSNVLEIFDISNGTWSQAAPMPFAVSGYALVTFEGKLYLFGGSDGDRVLNSVLEYRPTQDIWQELTPMLTARTKLGAAVAGGNIYVIGGHDGKESLAVTEIYQPSMEGVLDNPWEIGVPMPYKRHSMAVTSVADIVQVIAGVNEEGNPLPSLQFIPQTNTWNELDLPPFDSWSDLNVVSIGTDVYVVGGLIDGVLADVNQVYRALYTISIPVIR